MVHKCRPGRSWPCTCLRSMYFYSADMPWWMWCMQYVTLRKNVFQLICHSPRNVTRAAVLHVQLNVGRLMITNYSPMAHAQHDGI